MTMFRIAIIFILNCLVSAAPAVPSALDDFHKKFDLLVSSYVRKEPGAGLLGRTFLRRAIRYQELVKSTDWQNYIAELAYVDEAVIKAAAPAAGKAFWLNTFNALVIDSVGRATPPLKAAPRNDVEFWKSLHNVAGKKYSLEQIRARIYEFQDPRVVFAMTEASAGSPSLPEKAFTATNVERQLDEAVRNIASDPSFVRLVRGQNTLFLAEIFQFESIALTMPYWRVSQPYRNYPPEARSVVMLIEPYFTDAERKFLAGGKVQIKYTPYLTNLNTVR